MISEINKIKILEAITVHRKNFNSDARHATALGIATSVYSCIKNGDTTGKLSNANWVTIARKLNIDLTNETPWNIVKTPTFEYIHTQLAICQKCSTSGIFCDLPDIGKTVTARYYAQNNAHVVYVDCSQVKSKQRLVRFIAREFGVSNTGRYADVYDDLVYYIRQLDRPLIILDEVGDLQYDAYLELKALWNATEHFCGWYQMGADALRAKIDRGIEIEKVGYAELKSRFGNKYQKSTPEDQKEREKFLFNQALMIAKMNVPKGGDYALIARQSKNGLRRVYHLITKPEMSI